MKKRVLSSVLCFVMLLSLLPISALAVDNIASAKMEALLPESASPELKSQVESEYKYLEDSGLLAEDVGEIVGMRIIDSSPAYPGAAATIEYTIDYDIFKETLIFTNLSDSKVSFESASENSDTVNSVEFYENGTIILDNEQIEVTSSVVPSSQALSSVPVEPWASDRWFQAACPYGSASDYTKYVNTVTINNVPLTKAIIKLTFSVVYNIIIKIATMPKAVAKVFTKVTFAAIQATHPETQGLSCIDYQYWHKSSSSGGYISDYRAYVTYHKIKWYSWINLKGSVHAANEFEIHRIY